MHLPRRGLWLACLLALACHAQQPDDSAAIELRVMSFNILRGGRFLGQPLAQTAAAIRAAGADIVGLQEQQGSAAELAAELGFGCAVQSASTAIISRFPIVQSNELGALLLLPGGREAWVFNVHLTPYPYQPYDIRDGKLSTAAQAEAAAAAVRDGPALAARIAGAMEQGPVFLVGDFNEPSHRDWIDAARERHFGWTVVWPVSSAVAGAGMCDAWRTCHPDPLAMPGDTWTPLGDEPDEVHDRIDRVYFAGAGVSVLAAQVVGEAAAHADLVVHPWPSDHRAVVAAFSLAAVTLEVPRLGQNLIRNPGAELDPMPKSEGFSGNCRLRGWEFGPGQPATAQRFNGFSVDAAASAGAPEALFRPETLGEQYFFGGQVSEDAPQTQQLVQWIELGALLESAGVSGLEWELQGWFGGWQDQNDTASLRAAFLDAHDGLLLEVRIGEPRAFAREGRSGLVFRHARGKVPAGLRRVRLTLELEKVEGGNYCDGAADGLSLVFERPD